MKKLAKLVAVRIRGSVGVKKEVLDTLRMIRLTRPNHCILIENNPSQVGMLRKAKEVITWGTIRPEVLAQLLRKRGRLESDRPLTDEIVDSRSPYGSIREFADSLCEGRARLCDVPGLKRVFRLRPPRKGYKSTRRPFSSGGALGDRGDDMNDLILRMM